MADKVEESSGLRQFPAATSDLHGIGLASANTTAYTSSPELLESHVLALHNVLYGAQGAFDLNDAIDFIQLFFEDDMRYENPLVSLHNRRAFIRQLWLFSNLPGQAVGELEEVYHRPERFGTVSFVFTHTYTWSLFGGLEDSSRCGSGFTSATATTARRSSGAPNSPSSPFLRTRLHLASRNRRFAFLSDLLGGLWPPALARQLTTLAIKVHTHVLFNEQGRVVLLEDDVSIRDLIESLPIVGHIYDLQRRAFAGSLQMVSGWLMSAVAQVQSPPTSLATTDGPDSAGEGLHLQLEP